MTVATTEFPRAFAVWFKDIRRWDASSFQRIRWHWPQRVMVPIGSVLRMRKERVDKTALSFSDLQPLTIHFDGSVEKRVVDADREYSMDLWFARPGDIVVAKIDLKNGAVGIVPPDWKNVVVTGHFAVYEPDRTRLLPEYLHRIMQAGFFKAHLWRNKVGAEGRKEVKLDFFEEELIPLPPLAEQKTIVARWRKAQDGIAATLRSSATLERELQKYTKRALGIVETTDVVLSKVFALQWGDMPRWSVEFLGRQIMGLAGMETGKYSAYPLASLCDGISGGTPSTYNAAFWDGSIPWVSPKDMKAGELFDSEDHISQLAVEETVPLVPANSVLVVVRSGILQRTVPIAVNRVPVSINQDIRAFVPRDSQQLSSDFLAVYLEAQRQAMLHLVKWSTTVQSINKEELEAFLVPLPPASLQNKIVAEVRVRKQEIAHKREAAERLARDINAEVEALILGTKNVSEL